MRFSGTRELGKIYDELGAVGYIASFSYMDLVRKLKKDNKYIGNLRVDIEIINSELVAITLFDRYPNVYAIIEFVYGGGK